MFPKWGKESNYKNYSPCTAHYEQYLDTCSFKTATKQANISLKQKYQEMINWKISGRMFKML